MSDLQSIGVFAACLALTAGLGWLCAALMPPASSGGGGAADQAARRSGGRS